ncbi:hypothetical protein [Actinoplanes palleronii]|uniref:HEAT repeat protein n=1 Tax=Actinoplanes palleronii TaxID=113570 RepID=A0ABQ4BFQ6_9ACTN|nr:hypothetical protein [Actinoplanes palleronii]GIE69508.1 hypothetical protein Apa02nite_056160 [Actinoplanes palleronii]
MVEAPVAATGQRLLDGEQLPVGAFVLVCDTGATTEASELRRGPRGFEVLSTVHAADVGELIRHEHSRYRLTEAVDVDVCQLQAAIAGVQRAITTAERLRAQQVVVDGYAGELAAGYDWPWIVPARETIRREALTGYVDLADGAEPGAAVDLLRAAMAVDPQNTMVRARTIPVLSELGDESAVRALQQ